MASIINRNRPSISSLNSWDKHAEKVIDVLVEALLLFYTEEGVNKLTEEFSIADDWREIEVKLNTALFFFLCKANRNLQQKKKTGENRGLNSFPEYEPQNSPNPNDRTIESIKRQGKKPDITWGYADFTPSDDINDSYKGNRKFAIECKRLGTPSSKSNILNKKYITEGIKRFVTDEHCYGENESSGAMVGYIEDMEFDTIFNEVNQNIETQLSIEKLAKLTDWQEKSTTQLHHSFERPFQISPFKLHHFWIDLRGCYPRSQVKGNV
jgi:hypothetical protein